MLPQKQLIYLFFLFTFSMIQADSFAQGKKSETIAWSTDWTLPLPEGMPTQPGVAGVFAGTHHGVLLVAGGANFPNAMPWEGGKKTYRDDIYVLQLDEAGHFKWISAKHSRLKQAIAYGSSITTPEGVVCIGGETAPGVFSKEAFLMQWDADRKEITIKAFPSIPVPLANAWTVLIGHRLYIGGGETSAKVSDGFFTLDMNAAKPEWEALSSVPVAMSHSVAVVQNHEGHACIYVIGGRTATASGISQLHNTVFCFDPSGHQWKTLGPISDGTKSINFSAGTGVALPDGNILLAGGDDGLIFRQIETYNNRIAGAGSAMEKETLQKEKLALLKHHPGFNKSLLRYHPGSDRWEKTGELPAAAQVTTTLVKWKNFVFIPSGEIKPGTRTPRVMVGKILKGKP